MPAVAELHQSVHDAQARLERALRAYRSAARLYLIAELLQSIAGSPDIAALHLSADYEYDDAGGYFRCLHGCVMLAHDAAHGDQLDDYWTEGLDVEQDVILELFGIDGVGEATLTRPELEPLAAQPPGDPGGP